MGKFIHICAMCGRDFENDSRKGYVCNKCEEKMKAIKKVEMIDKAERKLTHFKGQYRKRNNVDISKEIEEIRKRVSIGIDTFGSIQETMVAIQLAKRNVKYVSQKKLGDNKVDFFLPELKIVLEIDGELYHTDQDKEFLRDRAIMRELGEKYEIVHLDTSCVPRYTWKLDLTLPMIISERNENWRFRDSFADSIILQRIEVLMKGNKYYE